MTRVERIQKMEDKLERSLKAVEELDQAINQFESIIPEIEELMDYYQSELWRKDYEADEKGKIPKDIKRGVLSQDGIYNLITDYIRLKELLNK